MHESPPDAPEGRIWGETFFVHSKPTEEYSSALRVALQHYRNELERAKSMPATDDVDDASPMERKVLHWLSQVPLIRDLGGDFEVIAQFELGKYLKQLDPSYRHPDYRVDFLVRVSSDRRQHQLVLEYDGFEFHFEKGVPAGMINASTWRSYLTSEDLEREKVLESFGVQMIRLNRFNLGSDPVATIDGLLRERLEGLINGGGPHDLVVKMAEKAGEIEKGLKSGEYIRKFHNNGSENRESERFGAVTMAGKELFSQQSTSPLKMRFWQKHVNAFVAINKLGHAQVTGERAQHISFVARQIGACANVFDHLPYRLLGSVVQILVESDGHQMCRTFGKRPG